MGALNAKIREDEPKACIECGEKTVWAVYAANCDICRMIQYLKFRHAMEWPLDEEEKKSFGLIPGGQDAKTTQGSNTQRRRGV